MKKKYSKKAICIIFLISIFSFSSCDEISDSIDETVDQAIDELLGITALSEDLNKTSSNYNVISDIVINNKLVSSSETKMTLPSSVPVSYTKKRYTLSGSVWSISTNSYSGTISKSMFDKISNEVKIVVQNNTPTVYVNNVAVPNVGTGGTGGAATTGGSGTTTAETKLTEADISGKAYELKVVSFTVPSGVKTMTVATNEPNNNYRNLADLYVRKGVAPIVAGPKPPTYLPKYTWTADYISQTPNREVKSCTITNPSSGTWYVGLYGYNSDYQSHLTVTIKK